MIEVEFLGTGTSVGVPMIGCTCDVCVSNSRYDKRLRSSIKICTQEKTIIVDTTPDFRYQMLRSATNFIDAVLITHTHKDHIAGLDDIRPYNFLYDKTIPIYGNQQTLQVIKSEFHYAFQPQADLSVPKFNLIEVHKTPFFMEDIEITPIEVKHYNMIVLGYRIGNFTYITDAHAIDEAELEKIKGSKVLVLNALRQSPHPSHFSLQEAIDIALKLKIPQVYFTHISHQMGFHNIINKQLPAHIQLAYDGLKISI